MSLKQKPNIALRPLLAAGYFFDKYGSDAWTEQRRLYRIEKISEELEKIENRKTKAEKELAAATAKAAKAQTRVNLAEVAERELKAKLLSDKEPSASSKEQTELTADAINTALEKFVKSNKDAKILSKFNDAEKPDPSKLNTDSTLDAVKRGIEKEVFEKRANESSEMSKNDVVRHLQEVTQNLNSILQLMSSIMQEIAQLKTKSNSLSEEKEIHESEIKVGRKLTNDERAVEEIKEKERKKTSSKKNQTAKPNKASKVNDVADAIGALLKHPDLSKAKREAGSRLENVGKDMALFTAETTYQALKAIAMMDIVMNSQSETISELSRKKRQDIANNNEVTQKIKNEAAKIEKAASAIGRGAKIEDAEPLQFSEEINYDITQTAEETVSGEELAAAFDSQIKLGEVGERMSMGGDDDIADQLAKEATEKLETSTKNADTLNHTESSISANPDSEHTYTPSFRN